MSHLNTGCNIGVEKQLLHCNRIRPEGIQQGQHIVVNLLKAQMQCHTRRRGDGTMPDMGELIAFILYHTISHGCIPRINAKNNHASLLRNIHL